MFNPRKDASFASASDTHGKAEVVLLSEPNEPTNKKRKENKEEEIGSLAVGSYTCREYCVSRFLCIAKFINIPAEGLKLNRGIFGAGLISSELTVLSEIIPEKDVPGQPSVSFATRGPLVRELSGISYTTVCILNVFVADESAVDRIGCAHYYGMNKLSVGSCTPDARSILFILQLCATLFLSRGYSFLRLSLCVRSVLNRVSDVPTDFLVTNNSLMLTRRLPRETSAFHVSFILSYEK